MSITGLELATLRYFSGAEGFGAEPPTLRKDVIRRLLDKRLLRYSAPSYEPTPAGDALLAAPPRPIDRGPQLERAIRIFPCFAHLREGREVFDDLAWEIVRMGLERMALDPHPWAHAARFALDMMRGEGEPARFDLVAAWAAWEADPAYRVAMLRTLTEEGREPPPRRAPTAPRVELDGRPEAGLDRGAR